MASLILLLSASTAAAWTPGRGQLNERRWHVLDMRHDKCLSTWQPRPLKEIPADRLFGAWVWWRDVRDATNQKGSRCRPTNPAAIIRYVFPAATEEAAVRVAYCESHLYTYARNASGASGLFQLMPIHWQGRFDPFDPWANTRYAYRLSHAGYSWTAWVCQPW